MAVDKNMLLVFFGYAQKNKAFGRLVDVVYRFSSVVFFLIYYAGGVLCFVNDRRALAYYLVVPFVSIAASFGLRRLFKRKRPYETLGIATPKNNGKDAVFGPGFSFPSNHSSSVSAIAFACIYIHQTFGVVVFFLAVITGLSRVFKGVHYPSDVLAGFVLSAVFAILGYNIAPTLLSALG